MTFRLYQNIYENEELVSVGKGTTVEWKSENETAVFKIDRADSDRCQFSINGVTFDQLPGETSESDQSPPSSTASRQSTREERERLSRDALINAVSQWREVRKPTNTTNANNSNSTSQPKQNGAIEEALRVQAELQELAGKLARDRDEALRRLQEWQARGGPEGSEGEGEGEGDSEYDQSGDEGENEEDDGDVAEEEFVTGKPQSQHSLTKG